MEFIRSKLVMILLILAVGWFSISFIKIKLYDNLVNMEVGGLEEKIGDLEKSNSLLEKFISYMSNASFLERQARIKLNYKALDEEVVFIYIDSSNRASSSLGDFRVQLAQIPNYLKWVYYLIGY